MLAGVMPATPLLFSFFNSGHKKGRIAIAMRPLVCLAALAYPAARFGRLREFRWKNSAWLATAETIAGWNGFDIRNAGSGRSPVRKRSG